MVSRGQKMRCRPGSSSGSAGQQQEEEVLYIADALEASIFRLFCTLLTCSVLTAIFSASFITDALGTSPLRADDAIVGVDVDGVALGDRIGVERAFDLGGNGGVFDVGFRAVIHLLRADFHGIVLRMGIDGIANEMAPSRAAVANSRFDFMSVGSPCGSSATTCQSSKPDAVWVCMGRREDAAINSNSPIGRRPYGVIVHDVGQSAMHGSPAAVSQI